MVKTLSLGLLVATMCCGLASCAPAPQIVASMKSPEASPPPPEDPSAMRSERSTSLSHITGTARKIQMFIKNHHLQLLPDGTVNGTLDDNSAYTILQRTTVGIGQMKIQGVGTCQYLCMDACGLLYGTREFNDECVFNEMIEQHHYNTYSSKKHSNGKRTMYLALNRRGQPRKVLLRAHQPLGRLSSYTRVLTRTVSPELVEEVHPMRHHAHMCASGVSEPAAPGPNFGGPDSESAMRCRRRKKQKKKKRKCVAEGDVAESGASELCHKRQALFARKAQTRINLDSSASSFPTNGSNDFYEISNVTKKCESIEDEQCQRKTFEVTDKKKLKGNKHLFGANLPKKKNTNKGFHKKRLLKSTEPPTLPVTVTEEPAFDYDYVIDSTTSAADWDESTVVPLNSDKSEQTSNLD